MRRSRIWRRQRPAGQTDEKIHPADGKTTDAPGSFMDQKVLIGSDWIASGSDLSHCNTVPKPVGEIVVRDNTVCERFV